jgi:hypothetical protein
MKEKKKLHALGNAFLTVKMALVDFEPWTYLALFGFSSQIAK